MEYIETEFFPFRQYFAEAWFKRGVLHFDVWYYTSITDRRASVRHSLWFPTIDIATRSSQIFKEAAKRYAVRMHDLLYKNQPIASTEEKLYSKIMGKVCPNAIGLMLNEYPMDETRDVVPSS